MKKLPNFISNLVSFISFISNLGVNQFNFLKKSIILYEYLQIFLEKLNVVMITITHHNK